MAPPVQFTLKSGVMTPAPSAAIAVTILNTDPGAYLPWISRFVIGFSGSPVNAAHAARSMPPANTFGSYAGRLVIARISPVVGSRNAAAPLNPAPWKASSSAFCRS